MADIFSREKRSEIMSRIRGKDTLPEMVVRKFLYAHGIRYRLHVRNLPGKPDIVIHKLNTIIDVRGCFWHGHQNCKFAYQVRSASEITQRIASAIDRDKRNVERWRQLGWTVIIIWDSCELESKKKTSEKRDRKLNDLLKKLLKKIDTNN
jgi:DNA mismatch endonuclease (patch repair protein)